MFHAAHIQSVQIKQNTRLLKLKLDLFLLFFFYILLNFNGIVCLIFILSTIYQFAFAP